MNFLFLPRFDFLALPPLPHSLFREHLSPPPPGFAFSFRHQKNDPTQASLRRVLCRLQPGTTPARDPLTLLQLLPRGDGAAGAPGTADAVHLAPDAFDVWFFRPRSPGDTPNQKCPPDRRERARVPAVVARGVAERVGRGRGGRSVGYLREQGKRGS